MSAAAVLLRRSPRLATLVGFAVALIGAGIGGRRLGDNSFLTHLATGRVMLDDGIVRTDVFTWTADGESLVVQSWLASMLYGAVEELGGFGAVRILMAATAAVLGWLAWSLGERSASLTTRVLVVVPVLWIGLRTWNERPLLAALVFFAAVMLWVEREHDPRLLAVVGVLWVNVHGSWPLGVVLLAARWIGGWADRDPSAIDAERRAATWLGAGVIVGGLVNPYGPALLWFPVRLLAEQETLRHVSEWQASSFQSTWTRLFLVMVAVGIFAARRASLRLVVPAVVFVLAALVSARNIPLATLVLVPLLTAGLPAVPGPDPNRTSGAIRAAVVALGLMLVASPLVVTAPHTDLDRYPAAAIDALEGRGLSPAAHPIVHQDFVGNYLALRYGPVGAAWIDDRFELHDSALVEDYLALLHGEPGWRDAIARHGPVAVVWERDRVLVDLLTGEEWATVWVDDDWAVLVPQ